MKNKRFVIASNNLAKTEELIKCFEWFGFDAISYQKLMSKLEFPNEGTDSYLENAQQKALFVAKYLPHEKVVADDSGMILEAYQNWLGVLTSRELNLKSLSDEVLNEKIIDLVTGKKRGFKMVSTLVMVDNERMFNARGEFKGEISCRARGDNGRGFDLILKPNGYEKTLAELSDDAKIPLLHRTKAVRNLLLSLD
jgi:XTP/dITP diphosphohydrolase